jgi:hypothetical protein
VRALARVLRLVGSTWPGTAADIAADTVAAVVAGWAKALGSSAIFQAQESLLESAGAVL